MEELIGLFGSLDWSPLWISLKTGIAATVISFFAGLYAARRIMKAGPGLRAAADGFLTLPMVLPPTVAGFFLHSIYRNGITLFPIRRSLYLNDAINCIQRILCLCSRKIR